MLKGNKNVFIKQVSIPQNKEVESFEWKIVNGFGRSVKGLSKYNYRISEREINGEKIKVVIRTDIETSKEEQKPLEELTSSMVAKIMYKDGFNILEKLDDKKKNSPSFIVGILDTAKTYQDDEIIIPNPLQFSVMKDMFKGNELFEAVAKISEIKANISGLNTPKCFKQTMLELASLEKQQQLEVN